MYHGLMLANLGLEVCFEWGAILWGEARGCGHVEVVSEAVYVEHDRVALLGDAEQLDGRYAAMEAALFRIDLLEAKARGLWVKVFWDRRTRPGLVFFCAALLAV